MSTISIPNYGLVTASTHEVTINKSVFRAVAAPLRTEQDATDFITQVSAKNATHTCWAWRFGKRFRCFDDGEPGGTAGRPILQAIDTQHFDQVIVAVSRWFGGIKLGTGGLIRAYGGVAAMCLRGAEKKPLIKGQYLRFRVSYTSYPKVRAKLDTWHGRQESAVFDESGVTLLAYVPLDSLPDLRNALSDLLRGAPISVVDDGVD